ncbi:MAG: histidinol-phosphate transaminase [Legionellales bacterium]|nr:histidinol-phosphate transaminase [Legionellales bacterium]
MPCDYFLLPHAGIQSLSPYIPGKSVEEVAREHGITNIIKLASNENAFGCSPSVLKVLASLSVEQIITYPQGAEDPLKRQLADMLALDEDMLTLGNGSDVFIPLLQTIFALHRDKQILTHDYAFMTYAIQAQIQGIPVIKSPLKPDFRVDMDAMIKACDDARIALIFLANPNNPTGLPVPAYELKRLIESIPETTVLVVDEAYYEFVTSPDKDDTKALLKSHPNLVIMRTFSKAYGLAGLRLGYAMTSPEITSLLHRLMLPFTVNKAALLAGSAALKDQHFIEKTVQNTLKGLQQVQLGLDRLKIDHLPSSCNFITLDCKKETLSLYQNLLRHGIIVRPLHPYGLYHHLRVTIGTEQQNRRFLDTFEELYDPK